MRTLGWSLIALTLGVVVGVGASTLLTRQFSRTVVARSVIVPAASGEEESTVQPTVLTPQPPARFFIDTVEPIVVRPESEETPLASDAVSFDEPPLPTLPPVKTQMPLADEEGSEEQESSGTMFWFTVLNFVEGYLNDIVPPETSSSEPVATEVVPTPSEVTPEAFPTANDQQPLHMPMIPVDPYHGHSSCPGMGGCPRGHMYFPRPAYHFERAVPNAD